VDACLVNTAIAVANNSAMMARAFKKGVEAGREAYLAGIPKPLTTARSSSPTTGLPW